MNSNKILPASGLRGIRPTVASALLSALSIITVVAGIAASTQAQAAPDMAKPAPFISDDVAQGMMSAGRSAHRLCRSPIRFLGTAGGRDVAGCKRATA
jgi:hypothetical protein